MGMEWVEPWPVRFCVYAPMLLCISCRVVSYGVETSYEILSLLLLVLVACGRWFCISFSVMKPLIFVCWELFIWYSVRNQHVHQRTGHFQTEIERQLIATFLSCVSIFLEPPMPDFWIQIFRAVEVALPLGSFSCLDRPTPRAATASLCQWGARLVNWDAEHRQFGISRWTLTTFINTKLSFPPLNCHRNIGFLLELKNQVRLPPYTRKTI